MKRPSIQRLRERMGASLRGFDRDESGAVLMLVLAGFLIIFLTGMMLFDAGESANEKMDVQIAADNAAYSHSVVKARSMNMIAYANIIKRMYYGYSAVYFSAYAALVESLGIYSARCASSWGTDVRSCLKAVEGGIQLTAETLELITTNGPTMIGRSYDEVRNLDAYQGYMFGITPWWAWVENVMRGATNGAMITTSWPPPDGSLTDILDKVTQVAIQINDVLHSVGIGNSIDVRDWIPAHTYDTDALPVTRRDQDSGLSNVPFFPNLGGQAMAHASYCGSYMGSMEQIALSLEHIAKTRGNMGISDDGQTVGLFVANSFLPLGCIAASGLLGDEALDWHIAGSGVIARLDRGGLMSAVGFNSGTENAWQQATSNLTVSYKPHAGRFSDDGERSKMTFLHREYDKSAAGVSSEMAWDAMYQNEGYWGMARSEIVYDSTSPVANMPSFLNSGPFDFIEAWANRPNMWSPNWTARLRPVSLPGEDYGETSHGGQTGLGAMYMDMLPYLLLASTVGLIEDDFAVGSAAKDYFWLYRVSSQIDHDSMKGFDK